MLGKINKMMQIIFSDFIYLLIAFQSNIMLVDNVNDDFGGLGVLAYCQASKFY